MHLDVDLNRVVLKKRGEKTEHFDKGVWQKFTKFDIMLDGRRCGVIDIQNTSLGLNYVTNFKINPALRGKGIGSYVLKRFFRGYFLSAGNPRVTSLYNRIGKGQDKFSAKENKILAKNIGMWGTWRIK